MHYVTACWHNVYSNLYTFAQFKSRGSKHWQKLSWILLVNTDRFVLVHVSNLVWMQRSAWIRQGRNIWQWPDKSLRLFVCWEGSGCYSDGKRDKAGGEQLEGENIVLKSPKENLPWSELEKEIMGPETNEKWSNTVIYLRYRYPLSSKPLQEVTISKGLSCAVFCCLCVFPHIFI